MDNREMLNFWRNKLLDTGKRNNLINFKSTKLGSVDVVYPNFEDVFSKVEAGKVFEVYDNKNDLDEVEDYLKELVAISTRSLEEVDAVFADSEDYVKEHTVAFKNNQILLFNPKGDPKLALRNIARNGRSAIEETGVNIVYMAFGFLNWTEKGEPNEKMKAPILLVAVSIENSSPLKPYYVRVIDTDFAENGLPALECLEDAPYEGYHSEFEEEVADFLRENGYEVDCHVGCSALKVDIAVKSPTTPDYLMAIECDGSVYRSAKNTRDRDRLRQHVLERMGWNYYRIWSTDWFRNKENEKKRLLDAIKERAYNDIEELSLDDMIHGGEISFEDEITEEHFDFPKYKSANVLGIIRSARSNKMQVIKRIVEIESPISSSWLLSRISTLFGTILTASVRREYENLLATNCEILGIKRKDGFLFFGEVEYPMLRVPSDDLRREIEYIPLEELAKGLEKVIELNVTITDEQLFSYIRSRLGFRSLTEKIRFRLEKALQLSIDSGRVVKEGIILTINARA